MLDNRNVCMLQIFWSSIAWLDFIRCEQMFLSTHKKKLNTQSPQLIPSNALINDHIIINFVLLPLLVPPDQHKGHISHMHT